MSNFKSCVRVLLCAILAIAAFAQTRNARLEGSVQDQSGAVVPNATVFALNNNTQAHAEAKTGAQGEFVFPDLQPGIYTLTVEAAGFASRCSRILS